MKKILIIALCAFSSPASSATFFVNKIIVTTGRDGRQIQNEFHPEMRGYIQLKEPVNTDQIRDNVDIYDIDLEDNEQSGVIAAIKSRGIKVVCYFSAGTYENWRSDKDTFTQDILGNNLAEWEGERWLDIRSAKTVEIMSKRIDRAANAGCDAVDPDNVDGYQDNKSGFPLTEADQLKYLNWLSIYAHSKGLKIGLKNVGSLIQTGSLHKHFDFMINESCYDYQECSQLKPFVEENKWVFILQYDPAKRTEYCPLAKNDRYFLSFFNRELDGSEYVTCP